jgi:hypothetical protein
LNVRHAFARTVLEAGDLFARRAVPAGTARLGQTPDEWVGRARRAVGDFDSLLARASTVADDTARGDILKWVGRSDVPGAPAERRDVVARDAAQAARAGAASVYAAGTGPARVAQLEESNRGFSARVSNAITAYGALPAPAGAGGTTGRGRTTAVCVTGGIALLGLVVVPLLLD